MKLNPSKSVVRLSPKCGIPQEEDMLNIQISMAELQNRCVDQGVSASI